MGSPRPLQPRPGLDTLVGRYAILALGAARRLPWRPVIASFLVARALVLLGMLLTRAVSGPVRRDGLLGWDAEWYSRIALHGYQDLPIEGRRFFPLLPLLARALGAPLGGHSGLALLLLTNAAALAFGLLAHRLCVQAGFGRRTADAVPWLIALAPAGFVLTMGYSESLFGVLVALVLLAVRAQRWWVVALCGLLAGALRPTGIVIAVPVLIEAVRDLPPLLRDDLLTRRDGLLRLAAVIAPGVGLAAYLAWCWYAFGNPLAPIATQADPALRGALFYSPWQSVAGAWNGVLHGSVRQAAPLLHVVWAALALRLLWAGRRMVPVSFTAFAAAILLLALTARGFSSFERYAASALPLLLVAAAKLDTTRRRRWAVAAGSMLLLAYSFTALLHAYIP